MEKVMNLKFCDLVYLEKDRAIKKEKELMIKAFNYNKRFFGIKIDKFKIKFVYSREDFDRIWGAKTEDFVSGFIKDDLMVLFSYSVFDKETKWKKKYFYECLLHEISHLFYEEIRDDSYDPLWLSEGLATFVQSHNGKFKYMKGIKIEREVLEEGFEEMGLKSYHVYRLFVEYLIKVYGKGNIFKLISDLKKGKGIDSIFKDLYKKSFEELIEDGNRYHKIA
jgi:hypothetical protein